MANASLDIAEIYRRMRPVLQSMDEEKDNLLGRFRPVMAIFFFYGAICFMVPYTNIVAPNQRYGLFYFLLISGGLAFAIVLLLYYRQTQELNTKLRQQFVMGLSGALGGDVHYHASANDLQFPQDINTLLGPFHAYQVRNLLIGKFPLGHLSAFDFKAFHRPEDFLRAMETPFDGRFYLYEFPLESHTVWLVPRTLLRTATQEGKESDPGLLRELTRRYAVFPPEGEQYDLLRDPEVDALINAMSEQVKKDGLSKHDLAFRFSENQMIIAMQENRSFLESFNWQNHDREEYVEVQLRAMNMAVDLIALLLTKYRKKPEE